MVDMNNIIKQLDQQTSIEYSSQEQNTFFSSVHGTFSRIEHILGHKSSADKFLKIEIIWSIFPDHTIWLDSSYRKKL